MTTEVNPAEELATPTRTFIFGLADGAGHLDAGPLYDAASAAGFTDTKLRLALKRMSDAGLITTSGRGRKADIRLTEAGLAERAPDLIWIAAAHRADAGIDTWDGRWHLATFEIPEDQRAARDALRNQMIELFGAQIAGGIYITPFPWEPWLVAVATAHDIRDRLTTTVTDNLDVGGTTNPSKIATQLWPVDELAEDYRAFLARWEPLLDAVPDDPAAAVRTAFQMSSDFDAVVRRDPILPAALVPDDFAGPAARRLYRQAMRNLSRHDVLANAGLIEAYESAIESALSEHATEFWTRAFNATSAQAR